MTKVFVVLATLLTVLFFITGCSNTSPKPAEPVKVEPAKVEPVQAEQPKPEPLKTEPPAAEPNKPQQPIVELPKTENSFHNNCANLLATYVNDKGMVNYRLLKRKKTELRKLQDQFDKLNIKTYESWPKKDKIAFWVNAYNIQMLKIIVDNYPIESTRVMRLLWPPDSVRHIKGIWDEYKFMVMDEEFTLSEIDQQFFRDEFDEPRVFFAISYASRSSPLLRNEPYYGSKLDSQLDDQVKKFLSNPLAFKIDREKHIVYLSALFQPTWYGNYFINKYGTDKKFKAQQPSTRAVLNFITKYVPEYDVSYLETANYSIEYMPYNWILNDQQ